MGGLTADADLRPAEVERIWACDGDDKILEDGRIGRKTSGLQPPDLSFCSTVGDNYFVRTMKKGNCWEEKLPVKNNPLYYSCYSQSYSISYSQLLQWPSFYTEIIKVSYECSVPGIKKITSLQFKQHVGGPGIKHYNVFDETKRIRD